MADTDAHTDARPEQGQPTPLWQKVLRVVGALVGVLVVLVLAVLLLLQTQWGAETAARTIIQQVSPLRNAQLTFDGIEGNWVGGLQLYDVRLVHTDSATGDTTLLAQVDTLRADYSLPALLSSTLHVESALVAGLDVRARQGPDSTWDWQQVLPPASEDTSSSGFAIRVDRFDLRHASARASFYSPRQDSVLQVRDLRTTVLDLRTGDQLVAQLDTLGLRAIPPGTSLPLQLGASGGLSDNRFTVDALQLDSPRSFVRGQGTLPTSFAGASAIDDVQFTLRADPLSFRDLGALVPSLAVDPQETMTLDARATGVDEYLQIATEAAFSGGGTLSLEGALTPAVPALGGAGDALPFDSLRYTLDGQIRNLRTSLITADTTATRINADLTVDIQGTSAETLRGQASARLAGTRLAGYDLRPTTLDLTMRRGEAEFTLESGVAGTRLAATGQVRPFDQTPTYRAEADISSLNPSAFTGGEGIEGDLNGTLTLDGTNFSPADLVLEARLNLAPSTLSGRRLEDGTFTTRVVRDSVQIGGTLSLAGGSLRLDGRLDLERETFTLDPLEFDQLDVAALTGDTTRSALTGRLVAEGRGFDPETMQLTAEGTLQNSSYGPYQIQQANARAVLDDGDLSTNLEAALRGGTFTAEANGQPFIDQPVIRVPSASFQNVDIGALAQDTTLSSTLNGTFSAQIRGFDPATMTLDSRLALSPSELNAQQIESAEVTAQLNDGQLDAEAQLTIPAGQSRLVFTGRPFDEVPTYAIPDGQLRDLNLGALAGVPDFPTRLTGSINVEGRGFDPATMDLQAGLALEPSTVNTEQIQSGTLTATVQNGTARLDTRLDTGDGSLTVEAQAERLDATPRYVLTGQVRNIDVAAFAGADSLASTLSLDVAFDGTGTTLDDLQFDANISSQRARLGGLRVDTLEVVARLQDGLLQADTVLVRSNIGRVTGGGVIALVDTAEVPASNFNLMADVTSLRPIEPLLGAQILSLKTATLQTRVYGRRGALRFNTDLELSSLVYNQYRVADVNVEITGARGDSTLLSTLSSRGSVSYLSAPSFTIEDTRFEAVYDSSVVDFSLASRIDQDRRLRLSATVDPRPDRSRILLNTLDLNFAGDQWQLLQDATITYGDNYRVSNFLLYSNDQQIAADGVIDFDGPQSFIVTIENVRTGAITDLVGLEGLGGRLSGILDMTGPAASPNIEGNLSYAIRSDDRDVGTLNLDLNYDSLALGIEARLADREGGTLNAEGRYPIDLRLSAPQPVSISQRPVQFDVQADSFAVGWIDPFVDPTLARSISGTLQADVSVRGQLESPELSGTAQLFNAGARLPDLDVTYEDVRADLDFEGNRVRVSNARLETSGGGGALTAEGVINLPDLSLGEYDLSVSADNFLAIDTEAFRNTRIDATLDLQGTTRRPDLQGDITVLQSDIFYSELSSGTELEDVSLTEADAQDLERYFGIRVSESDTTTFDTYEAMAMNLDVEIQRNTWLRSQATPEFAIQLTGELDVTKNHMEDVRVVGTIEVLDERSFVNFAGREFDVENGTVTFSGDPANPLLDLEAIYRPQSRQPGGGSISEEDQVSITLALEGRPTEGLTPELSANPPMETRDILSYLATGRPADELFSGGGGGGSGSLAENLAFGQVSGLVEGLVAGSDVFDVVRFQVRPNGTSIFTLGSYVTPRLYVATEIPVSNLNDPSNSSTAVPDFTMEYELTDYLLVRALLRQNTSLSLNFLFEYAY